MVVSVWLLDERGANHLGEAIAYYLPRAYRIMKAHSLCVYFAKLLTPFLNVHFRCNIVDLLGSIPRCDPLRQLISEI